MSGGGEITVNAEMRVGGVQETITVTGERRSSMSARRGGKR